MFQMLLNIEIITVRHNKTSGASSCRYLFLSTALENSTAVLIDEHNEATSEMYSFCNMHYVQLL